MDSGPELVRITNSTDHRATDTSDGESEAKLTRSKCLRVLRKRKIGVRDFSLKFALSSDYHDNPRASFTNQRNYLEHPSGIFCINFTAKRSLARSLDALPVLRPSQSLRLLSATRYYGNS
jgi:hypothetical protein